MISRSLTVLSGVVAISDEISLISLSTDLARYCLAGHYKAGFRPRKWAKLVSLRKAAYNRRMTRQLFSSDFDRAGGDDNATDTVWSVSALNQHARSTLERHYSAISVEGEISDLIQHRSGHWYFTLKDDESQLRAAMFKFQNRNVRFNPENGQQVLLTGKLSLYAPRGSYQFIADRMAPAGLGQLQKAFEELKQKLQKKGFFDSSRKQSLPAMPKQVAVITSPQGAAIRDIQTTFARRYAGVKLIILPVAVQGDGAAAAIADAIDLANHWANENRTAADDQPLTVATARPEAIIVGRGGGSLEDLWAFNEQVVAEAIYRSALPVVSAVGHETDVTIADFVADVRAATPTAAAELLSPDRDQLMGQVLHLTARLQKSLGYQIERARLRLGGLAARVKHPSYQLSQYAQRLDQLDSDMQSALKLQLEQYRQQLGFLFQRLQASSPAHDIAPQQRELLANYHRMRLAMQNRLGSQRQHWQRLAETLNVVSPLATLNRGYAIVDDSKGNIVRSSQQVKPGDQVRARLGDGALQCEVKEVSDA